MDLTPLIQKLAVSALPIILALTLREIAHGWAARALGDRTGEQYGRLSLNPLNHVDPIGTLLLPGVSVLLGGLLIGWAKPVPVDWRNFRNPRKDMALVAVAALLSNLAMAIVWGLIFKFAAGIGATEGTWYGVTEMAKAGMGINLAFMVLNLLPLPPLDGGRVLIGILPAKTAYKLAQIEPYSMVILLLLFFTGIIQPILYWPFRLSFVAVTTLIGL